MSGSGWLWCGCCLGMCAAVMAEPHEPLPVPTAEVPATLLLSLPSIRTHSSLYDLPLGVATVEAPSTWSRLSVVELPAETLPGGGPQRRHHALRFGLDTPRLWLRSMGLDASECGGQLRAPSKLRPASRGEAASFDAQLQVRLQCQY